MEGVMSKRWNWLVKGTVICCMVCALFGCNQKEPKKEEQKSKEKVVELEKKDLKEDVTMMAVGDVKVPYKEVLFYIYQIKNNYEEGFSASLWDYKLDGKETVEEYAKDKIISELTQLKIIGSEAKKEKHELSEEEMVEIQNKAEAYFESISKDDLKKYGFTNEFIENIFLEHAIAAKMFDVVAGTVDTSMDEEEVRQTTIQYIKINTGEKGEKERGKDKKKAEKLLRDAKKAKDFIVFAENQSFGETKSVTFGKDMLPKEFGETAFKLKKGEISNLIEGENAFYIMYCTNHKDEKKTAEKKEEIMKERQDKAFREAYKKWSKEYRIVISTTLWDKVKFVF